MLNQCSQNRSSATAWLPLVILFVLLVLRILSHHGVIVLGANLNPLMALAFTGALFFPKNIKWWGWAVLLPVVDVISLGPDSLALVPYACYAFAAWWGGRLRGRVGVLDALGGTLVCSVLFYLVTNSFSWLTDAAYSKNLAGWVQALTTGTPGYPTTLEFFRNSLVADLIGTAILLASYNAEAILRHLQTLPLIASRRALPSV